MNKVQNTDNPVLISSLKAKSKIILQALNRQEEWCAYSKMYLYL